MIEISNDLVGKRIRLLAMPDDPCPIPPGTTGTVTAVNMVAPAGYWQITVKWDIARSLLLAVPPDTFEIAKGGQSDASSL